jgi:hypothetical protein
VANGTDLHTFLLAVLAASQAALDEIPTFAPGLSGAPERTYVSAGTPVLDCCGQLTVNGSTIREGATEPLGLGAGTRHKQNFRINHVGVNIYVTRCAELGDPPPPVEALQAVAEQTNADAWALWNYLFRRADLVALCDELFMDALTPLQPSGGCFGWLLTMRAQLAGYEDGAS